MPAVLPLRRPRFENQFEPIVGQWLERFSKHAIAAGPTTVAS